MSTEDMVELIRDRIEEPLREIYTTRISEGLNKNMDSFDQKTAQRTRLQQRVWDMMMASRHPAEAADYMWLSRYRLRKKRMKAKFLKDPKRYLPDWFFSYRAVVAISEYLRLRSREDGFARRIFEVCDV